MEPRTSGTPHDGDGDGRCGCTMTRCRRGSYRANTTRRPPLPDTCTPRLGHWWAGCLGRGTDFEASAPRGVAATNGADDAAGAVPVSVEGVPAEAPTAAAAGVPAAPGRPATDGRASFISATWGLGHGRTSTWREKQRSMWREAGVVDGRPPVVRGARGARRGVDRGDTQAAPFVYHGRASVPLPAADRGIRCRWPHLRLHVGVLEAVLAHRGLGAATARRGGATRPPWRGSAAPPPAAAAWQKKEGAGGPPAAAAPMTAALRCGETFSRPPAAAMRDNAAHPSRHW